VRAKIRSALTQTAKSENEKMKRSQLPGRQPHVWEEVMGARIDSDTRWYGYSSKADTVCQVETEKE
jgi:hypothetical protein